MVLLSAPVLPGAGVDLVSELADGAGGGVLDKVPGTPPSDSLPAFLSSLTTSERVLGPFSRVS